ncbi:phage tail protein [Listeria innocua]|uniref:phage tail protein n=1 Tax=Listeria innocua TaxID=1642 RepID=UPI0016255F0F|nr:phage tail protein [Listeria innocua]MBC1377847.1 phage tail protein [Listeria innocua]MBC1388648.1 phage tail protein [Listeria innocua]
MIENFNYDVREGTHGTSYGAFAEINRDEQTGALTFGVPKPFTGLRSVSFETSQESSPFFADNREHLSLSGAPTTTGSLKTYQFSKDFLVYIGKKIMSNGGMTDTGSFKAFVWQFIETVTDEFGNSYDELRIFYNVKASVPTAESVTDEDSVTLKEFEVPLTASQSSFVVDGDGTGVTEFTIRRTEANATLFDLAYEQVILPTDVPTASPIA